VPWWQLLKLLHVSCLHGETDFSPLPLILTPLLAYGESKLMTSSFCPCVLCVHLRFRNACSIFTKFRMDVMPLDATPASYFLIP
jgi:hypothetical protein